MAVRLIPILGSVSLLVLPSPPSSPLDVRTAHYLEDAAEARPVAAIAAALHRQGDAVVLELEVLAIGAGIEPLPGVEGAPGANLRTAEELDFLLAEGALALTTRSNGAVVAGELLAVDRGPVPMRRLLRDGRVDRAARSSAALPLAVRWRSAPLPAGTSQSYLVAGAAPRLRIECECAGSQARIVAIESLGEPHPVTARRAQ